MFDVRRSRPTLDPALAAGLSAAAGALARLDEALAGHPLRSAFLYRARLEAVRRQAAVDGHAIDPWHLAAVLEGLRLRMDGALGLVDRGGIIDAARVAFELHQWITAPDFDQEGEVRRAEAHLTNFLTKGPPLLATAHGLHAWLDAGETRPPIRAALIRFWTRHRMLTVPVPLTGTAALRAETPFGANWPSEFLQALAREAEGFRELLRDQERAWLSARGRVAGRRRDSHVIAAVDLLAATPLVSATSLAGALGIAVKTAIRLLDGLLEHGVIVEVTHRSKRRLFGLKHLAPLGEAVRPPYRPMPGRGRGRPLVPVAANDAPLPSMPPVTPIERRLFDYSDLEHAIAHLELTTRQTRQSLDLLLGTLRR